MIPPVAAGAKRRQRNSALRCALTLLRYGRFRRDSETSPTVWEVTVMTLFFGLGPWLGRRQASQRHAGPDQSNRNHTQDESVQTREGKGAGAAFSARRARVGGGRTCGVGALNLGLRPILGG